MRIFLPYPSVVFLVSGLPAQMDPLRWMTVRGQLLLKREIVPAADLPDARLLVARQLILQGAIPEATTELRAYLPYAPPPKREFVESGYSASPHGRHDPKNSHNIRRRVIPS